MRDSRRRPARRAGGWLVAGAIVLASASAGVQAQVPPSGAEIQAYGPLHAAALRGDLAMLAATLAGHAPVDARDGHGRTALHVATFASQREAIRLLAAAGADLGALEHERHDALTIAAVADDEETLALLLSLGANPRLITSRYDGTALIAAAHLGHDGVVRQLIAAGAPLDHVNNLHWSATIEAVVLGNGGPRHQATLRALVDAGADLSLTDREGRTALQLARSRGQREMVRILEAGVKR
jgi:uncharacterized protein